MLMWNIAAWNEGWFQPSSLAGAGLSAYHGWMIGYAKKLARGERPLSGKQLRMLNEVPGLIAVIVVILGRGAPFLTCIRLLVPEDRLT
jgi:putative membrane protein